MNRDVVMRHIILFYSLKFLTLTQVNKGKTQTPEEFKGEMKKFNRNIRKFMNKLFSKTSGSGGLSGSVEERRQGPCRKHRECVGAGWEPGEANQFHGQKSGSPRD